MADDPYAQFGGSVAKPAAGDPYAEFGGSTVTPSSQDKKPTNTNRFVQKAADTIGEFGQTIGDDLVGLAKFQGKALVNPFGAVGDIVESGLEGSKREYGKAQSALKKGDYWGTAIHGLGTIPLIGPAINDTGEDLATGHYGRPTARVLEAAALHKVQGVKPKVLGGVAKEAKAFTKVNTRIAASKWLGPTPTEGGIRLSDTDLENTLAHIQDAHGKPITSNAEAIAGAEQANQIHKQAFNEWMQRGIQGNASIVGNDVVKAVWDRIPADLKEKNPKLAQRMMTETRRAYQDKMIPVDKVDEYRKNVTDRLSFYKKSTGDQIRSLGAGSNEAVMKAERDALADGLYRALDPESGGKGPRTIRQQQSQIIKILDGARKRQGMAISTKPVSKLAAAKEAIPQTWRAIRGAEGFGHNRGATLGNLRTIMEGTVDPRVRETFASVRKPPSGIPRPTTPLRAKPQLAAPNKRIETTDPSGPIPQPFYDQPEWTQPGTRNLLPAAESVQQPGFALSDAVPVTNPATNRLGYVPQHWEEGQVPASKTLNRGSRLRSKLRQRKLTEAQQRAIEALRRYDAEQDTPSTPSEH